MSRDLVALTIPDLSSFARRLRAELAKAPAVPGHLGLLSMVARAGGFGNYQHLKVQAGAVPAKPIGAETSRGPTAPDQRRIDPALRCFDRTAKMQRWPSRTKVQALCLWALWAVLPARVVLSEKVVNARIDDWHGFGDRALLRRSLIDHGLFSRSADGREYRRIEREPPPEARAVFGALRSPGP